MLSPYYTIPKNEVSRHQLSFQLLHHSWQRPSTVTTPQWANVKQHGGYQMVKGENVLAHQKMAWEGPAGITMAKDDYQLVCNNIHKTHPSQMNHSTHNVVVGLQGNPLKQQNKNIQWLGVRYKVEKPCCTNMQQVRRTETGIKCNEPTKHLTSHQMLHSHSLHYKYYQKLPQWHLDS